MSRKLEGLMGEGGLTQRPGLAPAVCVWGLATACLELATRTRDRRCLDRRARYAASVRGSQMRMRVPSPRTLSALIAP